VPEVDGLALAKVSSWIHNLFTYTSAGILFFQSTTVVFKELQPYLTILHIIQLPFFVI